MISTYLGINVGPYIASTYEADAVIPYQMSSYIELSVMPYEISIDLGPILAPTITFNVDDNTIEMT
jgi:hypothetical protein